MHIASNVYTASRENTSRFEGSKKELSLKTTKLSGNKDIKQTLSESGPESLLASHGKYSHTRTFAVGRAQKAVLAFSEEKQRVDGFVVNKDQQLVPIQPHDLPKELKAILSSEAFDAFLKDIHARLTQLSNGDFRLDLHQGLKGGVYSKKGNINKIKTALNNISIRGNYECRIIIYNKSSCPLLFKNILFSGTISGNNPGSAFLYNTDLKLYTIPPKAAGGILHSAVMNCSSTDLKLFLSFLVNDCTITCGSAMCHKSGLDSTRTAYNLQQRILIKVGDGSGKQDITEFFNGTMLIREELNKYTSHYCCESTSGMQTDIKILVTCESTFLPPYRGDFIFTFLDLNSAIPREILVKNENALVPAAQNQENMDINAMLRQLAEGMNAMQNTLNTLRQTP